MICKRLVILCLLGALAAHCVDFVNFQTLWEFSGESLSCGNVQAEVALAPGHKDLYSLKVTFYLTAYAADWLDVRYVPDGTLDWRQESAVLLPYYAEQEGASPWLKITSANAPGANKALHEAQLLLDGTPPAARQWHRLSIPLDRPAEQKEQVTSLGIYLPTREGLLPLNQPVVFYLGLFPLQPIQRPPWPPQISSKPGLTELWQGPFTEQGWIRVKDHNNQNDHAAEFVKGAAEFNSTADGWNEFLHSDATTLQLKPNTTYRLQFSYDITRNLAGSNACFYSLVRAKDTIKADVGWQRWYDARGSSSSRVLSFTTRANEGYYLIFGIRDRGGIRIRDLALYEMLIKP
jgi:hypothetical protein